MSQNLSRPVREPIFNLPSVVTLSIGGLIAIHALRLLLPDETDFRLLIDWAVIPARWSVAYGGVDPAEILNTLRQGQTDPENSPVLGLAQYVLQGGDGRPWTALTYAFLHGSWTHVIINSVWLAAFGSPIARRCGTWRFFALAAAAAVGGAVFYAVTNPFQVLPMIGASAAVSGMMAAASWFMFSPQARLPDGRLALPHERPREGLFDIFRNRQVLIFLLVWFAANYLFAFVQPVGIADANIAWQAHIGGFLVGLVLFPFIDRLPAGPPRISA